MKWKTFFIGRLYLSFGFGVKDRVKDLTKSIVKCRDIEIAINFFGYVG